VILGGRKGSLPEYRDKFNLPQKKVAGKHDGRANCAWVTRIRGGDSSPRKKGEAGLLAEG